MRCHEDNTGFIGRRSIAENIAAADAFQAGCMITDTKMAGVTLNAFRAAVPSVDQELIWKLFKKYGLFQFMIRAIMELYADVTVFLCHGGKCAPSEDALSVVVCLR